MLACLTFTQEVTIEKIQPVNRPMSEWWAMYICAWGNLFDRFDTKSPHDCMGGGIISYNLLTSNLVAHLSIKRSSSLLHYVVESKHVVNPLSKGYTGYIKMWILPF